MPQRHRARERAARDLGTVVVSFLFLLLVVGCAAQGEQVAGHGDLDVLLPAARHLGPHHNLVVAVDHVNVRPELREVGKRAFPPERAHPPASEKIIEQAVDLAERAQRARHALELALGNDNVSPLPCHISLPSK